MSVLSGLTQHHRMSLVHITHYNDEADAADRTVNLTGNGGAADNTEMVETASAPAADGRGGAPPETPVLELTGVSHEYGSGTPWATTGFARHQLRRARGRRRADPRPQRVRQVDAGVDHGRARPCRPPAACLLDGPRSSDQVGARGDLVSGGPAAVDAQPRRIWKSLRRQAFRSTTNAGWPTRWRMVGLDPTLASRRIDQLSGGQMRRVVLAGLLARSPRALILDEPLAGLDAASQRGLLRLLEDLRRNAGLTVVVISHDFSGSRGAVSAHAAPGERRAGAAQSTRGRHVMTAPDRGPAATQAGRAAAARARRQCHPPAVGWHETSCGGGHRRAVDVLPGLGAHRCGRSLVLVAAWVAGIPRGTLPIDSAVVVDSVVPRRADCDLRGRRSGDRGGLGRRRPGRAVELPAHHGAVDRPAGSRCDGVVDHERRRDRARRGHIGTAAAAAEDSGRRLGGRAGVGAAGVPDADRRVPRAVRGATAAARRPPRRPAFAAAAGSGGWR